MSLRSRWANWRRRRRNVRRAIDIAQNAPLREFVYLDEVSVQSLLVSQKSTILENVSEGVSRAAEAEVTTSVTADALVAKGEVASRYQTSRSANIQTSRRAIIQSLFKEFREVGTDYRLAPSTSIPGRASDLATIDDPERSVDSASIIRGSLIEVNVILRVDPVYRLAAMMSEYEAMAEIWPAMFGQHGLLGTLQASQPVMRILERFLAGLIPIKARAVDLVVVEQGGRSYIVHRGAVPAELLPQTIPLDIVGVTEQSSYWKDLRRILYSDGEFIILCRVARSGVQESWTPVKLADLFSEVAPDLVESINAIRHPGSVDLPVPEDSREQSLRVALRHYYDALVLEAGAHADPGACESLSDVLTILTDVNSSTQQREAFDAVRELVEGSVGKLNLTGKRDLQFRTAARSAANLMTIPATPGPTPRATPAAVAVRPAERLLDVEVIAIYW